MASLTSFLPHIAPNVGHSVGALYERQRALVRLGHLPAPQGRGRGSGAAATPGSVALVILAVMATDNLSDTDDRITKLADAPYQNVGREKACLATRARVFADAVAGLLQHQETAAMLDSIEVDRSNLSATIYFRRGKRKHIEVSWFGQRSFRPFKVTANLDGGIIRKLAKILREETGNGSEE